MSKVPVNLLPASVQTLVERLTAAGFTVVSATTGNGRRNLGDDSEPTAAERAEATRRDELIVLQDMPLDVLDITHVRLTRRQSFETCTIEFTPSSLKVSEQADSTPVAVSLPAHWPAACRAGAQAIAALGYSRRGDSLTFIKGNRTTDGPDGISVGFSWC